MVIHQQYIFVFLLTWSVFVVNCEPILEEVDEEMSSLFVEEMGNKFEGDIVLQPTDDGRGVAIRPIYSPPWPNGIIPYEIADNITANHSILIEKMMREMEELTAVDGKQCISFRPKNESDIYFITIFNGTGCYAPVGSWGNYTGVRPVSLLHSRIGTCMVTGIIQHELTHVLGFFHEQSRPDRDNYVLINWANIQNGTENNFLKYSDEDVDTLKTTYDYGSVMHYDAYSFAVNRTVRTIIAVRNQTAELGQRVALSPIDILEIQRYYGCVPTPGQTSAVTRTTTKRPSTTNSNNDAINLQYKLFLYMITLLICVIF